jgi:hypothetical protein
VLVVQAVIGNAYLALGALAVVAVVGVPVALRLPHHAESVGDGGLAASR